MKIVYGVQGTGNGHINKSREVIKELKKRGHEVLTIFSGRDKNLYWDISEFEPALFFKGLSFVARYGNVEIIPTILNLDFFQFFKDVNTVGEIIRNYDFVITDYEPITAFSAKKNNVFSIQLSHQASFRYKTTPITNRYSLNSIIMNNFCNATLNIGVHWDSFSSLYIIPPIINTNLKNNIHSNKYLVYLPFENIEKISKVLKQFEDKNFYVYNKTECKAEDNIIFKKLSRNDFLKDLEEAEGIICNSGFELICESLSIGKKILTKPVKNQVEQESNAKAIEILNIGITTKKIDYHSLDNFFKNGWIKKIEWPNTSEIFIKWLEEADYDLNKLNKLCWK